MTESPSYQNKKGWTVIKELLGRAGLDGYMEYDESTPRWTLRTFVQEDIVNTNATIAYGVNLISMGDYGTDNSEIYNRVIAYGATESDNILLLKTEEDTDSQSNFWIKDKIVQDTSLNTMDEVEQTAEYELSLGLDNVANGRVTIICNPTLKPGEMVECSVPYCGFNGLHKIQKYTHNFGNTVTTSIEVSKKIKTLKDIFVEKVNPDDYINTSPNINNMRDSYTIYFNESPSRMNLDADTEISDGKLKLKSGSSTGTATSLQLTTDYDVTECELRRFENYATDDDTIEVSNDGGINWESLDKTSGNVHEFSVPGNKIMFRINMSNANGDPQYESICMLYK
ncbi:hypothetical protein [Oceanihabitans sediminis]|uniref:hypothetical protein n=1 Tax=Oceanihabitans sediminis TaxID=1812012 RepID=UPI00299D8ADB|nr:hypothetical protein [Oceanihabitans sediminis]MDX1279013.1 hypothetical protein [Oceanihabitans sediminis]